MTRGLRPRSPGLAALCDQFIGDDPVKLESFGAAKTNAEIARAVYRLRNAAGLSQRELAERVGTSPSVMSRLEDADYDGHSLSMLNRVAAALGRRVELRFPPAGTPSTAAPRAKRRGTTKAAKLTASAKQSPLVPATSKAKRRPAKPD